VTRLAICGPDRAGKTTLAKRLSAAGNMPIVNARNEVILKGYKIGRSRPGLANILSMDSVIRDSPKNCILDRGPLCTAAIHWTEWGVRGLAEAVAIRYDVRTIFLDLPLEVARSRREDAEAETRNLEAEYAKYRELASGWPNTFIIDATLHPERVFYNALQILQA
jgi:thymidylate kinase